MGTDFVVGDIVQLKSGGPEMTISEIIEENDETALICQWFVENKLESAPLDPRMVEKTD